MSKTVAGWFGRTHSKSMSKELNKQGTTSEQDKENNMENNEEPKALTKCDSLPINPTNSFESEDEAEDDPEFNAELGPLVSLKEQLEKDKEDESLRRWKAQLLGVASDEPDAGDGFVEPEVTVTALGVISKGRPDSHFPLPLGTNSRGYTFSLKEGSTVSLKYVFTVRNNIVSGLTCINTVWKAGFQVGIFAFLLLFHGLFILIELSLSLMNLERILLYYTLLSSLQIVRRCGRSWRSIIIRCVRAGWSSKVF
jgi:hypothetical protein